MTEPLRILIVGGYGTFGGRIVELLENEPRLTLIVAGRSLARARSYSERRDGTQAQLMPAVFDRGGDLAAQLAQHRPDLLVDASGPFQAYGERRYGLIEACIAAGIDYLDLADGSDFVAGVPAYNAAAKAAGRYVLSGVSSFPVLTAAVVRRLARDMARVRGIRGGIAPSPYAGVGLNVIRAIAAYAGQRVRVRSRGRESFGHPFTEQMRFTVAPPGRLPLRDALFSLVDVPDLRALPELWPEAESIWMGAAPVPEVLHRALIGLAWLVRFGLLPRLSPLAPLMHLVTNHVRWGEHRGGMFVTVSGDDAAGAPVQRSWHLLAEGNDGPLIPSMAVQGIVGRVLGGDRPPPGARAAVRDLELEDYQRLFAARRIFTGIRDDLPADRPLYVRLLGSAWDELPAEIRQMHDVGNEATAEGRASVERGHGLLARLIASVVGFPQAAADVPVRVSFAAANGGETWVRRFGDQEFSSRQLAGTERWRHLLCERFGAVTFAIALVVEDARLSLILRRWSAFGVPLPLWLCPRAISYETVEEGRFRFYVEIGHPLCGLIIRYRGWLTPVEQKMEAEPPAHAAASRRRAAAGRSAPG